VRQVGHLPESYKYSPGLTLIGMRRLSVWRITLHDYKLTVTSDGLGNKFVVSFIRKSLIQTKLTDNLH
jgi:hypothetical protein